MLCEIISTSMFILSNSREFVHDLSNAIHVHVCYLGDVPQTDLLVYNSVSIAGSVNTKSAKRS